MDQSTELIDRYLAGWNEPDSEKRKSLVSSTYTEDCRYLDPVLSGEGRDGIADMIGQAQTQFPGHRFARLGEPSHHHDCLRFSWELRGPGGSAVLAGTDFATVVNGKLREVVGFFDAVARESAR